MKNQRSISITEDFSHVSLDVNFWDEIEKTIFSGKNLLAAQDPDYCEIRQVLRSLAFSRLLCYKWMRNRNINKTDKSKIKNISITIHELYFDLSNLDMSYKEHSISPLPEFPRLHTTDPKLAAMLEAMGISDALITEEELSETYGSLSAAEIAEIGTIEDSIKNLNSISPLPEFPRLHTTDPKLAAMLEAMGISDALITEEELQDNLRIAV